MTVPVTLTFRHLSRSGALESAARDIGHRLQQLHHRVTACHIVLEGNTDTPAAAGGAYQVKIHVSVPGAQIHAEGGPPDRCPEGRNALQMAYENAKRQLERLKSYHRPDATGP